MTGQSPGLQVHAASLAVMLSLVSHTAEKGQSLREAVDGLTKGCWVVVHLAQGTDGMLMLSELHKAQTPGAGQPICGVHPFRVPQNLGLLHLWMSLGCVLLHLYQHSMHLYPQTKPPGYLPCPSGGYSLEGMVINQHAASW